MHSVKDTNDNVNPRNKLKRCNESLPRQISAAKFNHFLVSTRKICRCLSIRVSGQGVDTSREQKVTPPHALLSMECAATACSRVRPALSRSFQSTRAASSIHSALAST